MFKRWHLGLGFPLLSIILTLCFLHSWSCSGHLLLNQGREHTGLSVLVNPRMRIFFHCFREWKGGRNTDVRETLRLIASCSPPTRNPTRSWEWNCTLRSLGWCSNHCDTLARAQLLLNLIENVQKRHLLPLPSRLGLFYNSHLFPLITCPGALKNNCVSLLKYLHKKITILEPSSTLVFFRKRPLKMLTVPCQTS